MSEMGDPDRKRSPGGVAEDDDAFATYLLGLTAGMGFRSRDDLDEAIWRSWASGDSLTPSSWMKPGVSDVETRPVIVALTWPTPFEAPLTQRDAFQRTPGQLASDITRNFASIAWRWWHSQQEMTHPRVDGSRLEFGEALALLGPRQGISPSTSRRLLNLQPTLLPLDELVDLASTLRLTFATDQPTSDDAGHWPLATSSEVAAGRVSARAIADDLRVYAPRTARWWVDDVRLAADIQLERRLLAYGDELAQQFRDLRPGSVHEKRIGIYGPPPAPTSEYYPLFAWLDRRTEDRFTVQMSELADIYAAKLPEFARLNAPPLNPGRMPPSAVTWPGWWSKPRAGSRPGGVGSQPQRVAWLTAGYTTKPSTTRAETGETVVEAVTFEAVPGRSQWHPFRARLRADPSDPLAALQSRSAVFEKLAEDRGAVVLRWFDRAGM